MDLMHHPRLERTEDNLVTEKSKLNHSRSSPDSAYESSEDGNTSPKSLPRAGSRNQSYAALASAGSRTSSVTELFDDSPPSRSTTPDSTYKASSTLSRSCSGDDSDLQFTATVHGPSNAHNHVIVRVVSQPDDDTVSVDEHIPAETIDKLLQTVSLPMLWELPEPMLTTSSSAATITAVTVTPATATESETTPDQVSTAGTVSPSEASSVVDCSERLDVYRGDTEDHVNTRQPKTSITSLKIAEIAPKSQAGCMQSSKRHIYGFFSACKQFFT